MRKSRVLLAGVAVAVAAVTTSAFTASNTLPTTSIAGYGEVNVTGATVSDVHYVTNAIDGTVLDAVEFTATSDITNMTSTLTLKKTGTLVASYSCAVKTAWNATTSTIVMTCSTTATKRLLSDFDATGISVVD